MKTTKNKMRIYYSGLSGTIVFPEVLIEHLRPCVMLSYHEFHTNSATAKRRFEKHLAQKTKKSKKKKL